jgi:kinesin family protein 6/9
MEPTSDTIRVLCRIRPSKRPSGYFSPDPATGVLSFHVPPDLSRDVTNNAGATHAYKFGAIFDGQATQEEVFDAVAKDAVDSCLSGFNSTVFAYGQTGSGKTFTITGGAERYADRGIIPRCLQRVFAAVKESTKVSYTVRVSYMEIYNENAYDLLDSTQETKSLEELP